MHPCMQNTFRVFKAECATRGLRCRQRHFVPIVATTGREGIMGHTRDYEGFLMMAVDHAHAHFQAWYRADFE